MSNAAHKFASLNRWERIGLAALLAAAVVFGVVVVQRTALRDKPKGDFGVYARAAWAVRAGEDLREATCNHGWHYTYPPTLAVLLTPLAEPPRHIQSSTTLPFAVSSAIWYAINLMCLVVAIHVLASAVERSAAVPFLRQQPVGCRSWWQLRLWPSFACLPAIGETLGRGQVNLMLLALICGFLACQLRGQPLRAGLCLAAAICIKIIPGILLLVPLWRRDRRCLLGCAIGWLVFGVAVPSLGLGFTGTARDYGVFYSSIIAPGLGYGDNDHMASDLTSITCGHSQSPMSMIHVWQNPERHIRPAQIPASTRLIHWSLAGSLLLLTLTAGLRLRGWWQRRGRESFSPEQVFAKSKRSTGEKDSRPLSMQILPPLLLSLSGFEALRMTLFVGAMTLTMLMASPMCHSHYLCLAIPLFMGLILCDWNRYQAPRFSRGLMGLMAVNVLATTVILLPGYRLQKDLGLGGMMIMLLWCAGVAALWQLRSRTASAAAETFDTTATVPAPHFKHKRARRRVSAQPLHMAASSRK